jgi:hypothetical protein
MGRKAIAASLLCAERMSGRICPVSWTTAVSTATTENAENRDDIELNREELAEQEPLWRDYGIYGARVSPGRVVLERNRKISSDLSRRTG